MANEFWYCSECGSQNHEIDGECQYCDVGLDEEIEDAPQSVDEYLDRIDGDRMEYDRLVDDLYPMPPSADDRSSTPRVHRDTDAVQVWMRQKRHES